MPQISEKGKLMPASPIRKLAPYADAAEAKGVKVYKLNIGQPDIKTPEVAMDALRNMPEKVIAYSHSAGHERYRRKLAEYYKGVNIDVDYSQILITTGGSEALLFGFMSCLNPGDEVITPEPFYANYLGFAIAAGVNIKPITTSIEDNFALPTAEEFEKLITPMTKAILICSPNNPAGNLYSTEEMKRLRDIVKAHDLYLFSDEVYREFCYDSNTPLSAMNLEGIEQNVIMVDSISKRYSACGARVGALITRNKEVFDTALKFAQARLSPPSLGQIVGEAALETPKSYFDEVAAEYIERRNLLVEGLNRIEGVYCPTPKGAFYAIARLPIDNADRFCQWILEKFVHDNQTVLMAPATGFYATMGLGENEVRIGYVLKKEELTKAIECLEEALKVYPGSTVKKYQEAGRE